MAEPQGEAPRQASPGVTSEAAPSAAPHASGLVGSWVPCLPYTWGTFQSWLFLVVGPTLVFGSSLFMVAPGVAQETRYAAFGYLVLGLLQFPTGLGLLKKKKFGLILAYVLFGLSALGAVIDFRASGRALATFAGALLCFYYYYKRRREFR